MATLSTVPTGNCAFCDATGYKLLSGTSMATPHVAGVAAALFHKNPLLTPAQMRDVLLDPGSYDAILEMVASSTTSGGRLNFAKALSNPLLLNPKLNSFPTVVPPADITKPGGAPVSLTLNASDPDGDSLRKRWYL